MSAQTTSQAEGTSTKAWSYYSPVAAFRNPGKPLPGTGPVTIEGGTRRLPPQGRAEAIVCAASTGGGNGNSNLLQYLSWNQSSSQYELQAFAGGYCLSNNAVVSAVNTEGAPGDVNFFWLDNNNVIWQNRLQAGADGQTGFTGQQMPATPTSSTVPSKYNPSTWNVGASKSNAKMYNLHVAYTPAVAGGGMNPVVYCAQNHDALVTIHGSATSAWTTTVFSSSTTGNGLAFNDLVLVPTSETAFVLFANVDDSPDLGVWTGLFGQPNSLTRLTKCFSRNPSLSGGGVLTQISAGVVNPAQPASACAFYGDSAENLLMWPANTSSASSPIPFTPVPAPNSQTALTYGTSSASGALANLYTSTANGSVYVAHQLMWSFGGQMPFFAPPSQIVTPAQGANQTAVGLTADPYPTDLPVVCTVDGSGNLYLYQLSGQQGQFSHGQYATGQWEGGQVSVSGLRISV